ncbi:hypothetical protein TruAng_008709 [Truncatella angustata]|nr:hypothetical protein TruAng_008709 [Truncatella angustata]
MPSTVAREPVVRRSTPMPKGYVFVPKGNVYVTGNCRKQTQAAGQTIFAVVDKNKRAVGIRVPRDVHAVVLASEALTRQDRASAVQKRDHGLERTFREAVKKLTPKAPDGEIPTIVARAMQKGSGRVGRTSKIDIEDKARLAVRAHIRHCHTDYDNLLKKGTNRDIARSQTVTNVDNTLKAWGGAQLDVRKDRKKQRTSYNHETRAGKEARLLRKTEKYTQSLRQERNRDAGGATAQSDKTQAKKSADLLKRTTKHAQTKRSGRNPGGDSSTSRTPPSPKELRESKLRTRRTRATSVTTSPSRSAINGPIGRSLRDDLSDIGESDDYVETTDTNEWLGTDDEDSD